MNWEQNECSKMIISMITSYCDKDFTGIHHFGDIEPDERSPDGVDHEMQMSLRHRPSNREIIRENLTQR